MPLFNSNKKSGPLFSDSTDLTLFEENTFSPSRQNKLNKDRKLVEENFTPLSVISELIQLTQVEVAGLFEYDDNGRLTLKPIDEIPPHVLKAVKKINFDTFGRVHSLEFYDKLKVLELLARYLGVDQSNVNLNLKGEININDIFSALPGELRQEVMRELTKRVLGGADKELPIDAEFREVSK